MCSSELRHGVSSKERQDGLGELRKHKAVWAMQSDLMHELSSL